MASRAPLKRLGQIVAAAVAAVVLAACGGSSQPPAQTTATGGQTAPTTTATTPPASNHTKVEAWCALRIGDSETSVKAKMGTPDVVHHAGSSILGVTIPAGSSALEWHVGNDILLASFTGGSASNLQAYAGAIGPNPATNLGCRAFRSG